MIRQLMENILWSKKRRLIRRNFNPQLFFSDIHHQKFTENGYVRIANVFNKTEVESLLILFNDIRTRKEYEEPDHYRNSMAYRDTGLKEYISEHTQKIAGPALSRIIDSDKAVFPFGGSYCVNPSKSKRGSPPHQDPTMIDEISSYAMTIWIALTDTNIKNGCLHLIPGSHLWGNIHRSVTIPWALEEYKERIREYMIPLEMHAGDAVIFDVSTIHGSVCNQSEATRLAVNFVAIPKHMQMLNYFPVRFDKTGRKAERFNIDKNYFFEESQFERPSGRYSPADIVSLDNCYSYKNLQELLQEYKDKKSFV